MAASTKTPQPSADDSGHLNVLVLIKSLINSAQGDLTLEQLKSKLAAIIFCCCILEVNFIWVTFIK